MALAQAIEAISLSVFIENSDLIKLWMQNQQEQGSSRRLF